MAALSLSGDDGLKETGFEVGQLLLRELSKDELTASLFTVTNLLNSQAGMFTPENPPHDQVIQLNLRSGKRALKKSAFNAAALCLDNRISLLLPGKWKSHFDCTLELCSTGAEAQHCVGDHEWCQEHCDEVNDQSSCPFFENQRVVRTQWFQLRLSSTVAH